PRLRARLPDAGVHGRSRQRPRIDAGGLRAHQQPVSRRRRDRGAQQSALPRHHGRRRHPHLPHRRHGAAAQGALIIRGFVRPERGGMIVTVQRFAGRASALLLGVVLCGAMVALPRASAAAQVSQLETARQPARPVAHQGGEANLVLPDLSIVTFRGTNGRTLLMGGLVVCAFGLLFGLLTFTQLKNLPVHASMREVSELIYETCKTYLITQGKFILILEVFIGVIMIFYFGVLEKMEPLRVVIILIFSLIGIGGSYGVAWFGSRVHTFA